MANSLVLRCMDRRFNNMVESEYGDAIVLGNAGANVYPLQDRIRDIVREEGIEKIIALPHTDCGAMGKVYSVLKGGSSADDDLMEELVSHYPPSKFSTRQELEKMNYEIQLARLKELFPDMKASGRLFDTGSIDAPKEELEHKLVVMKPGKPDYSRVFASLRLNPFQCYVVQAETEIAMADIKLAVKELGAKTVYFVTMDGDNPRDTKQEADRAALALSGVEGVEIRMHDMRRVRKSLA